MHLSTMLDDLVASERTLADSFRVVSAGHAGDPDAHFLTATFARECDEQVIELLDLARRLQRPSPIDAGGFAPQPLAHARTGPLGLLRDLRELHGLGDGLVTTCRLVRQAALVLGDRSMVAILDACSERARAQMAWLQTALDKAAPQALIAD